MSPVRLTLPIAIMAASQFANAETLYLNGWQLTNIFSSPDTPFLYVASGSLQGEGTYSGTVNLESDSVEGIIYSGDWLLDVATGQISTSNATCTMISSAAIDGCVGLLQSGSYSTTLAVSNNDSGGYNAVWESNNGIDNVSTFIFGVDEAPVVNPPPEPEIPPVPPSIPPPQVGPAYDLVGWGLENVVLPDRLALTYADGSISGDNILTGDVVLSNTETPDGFEYSATWTLDISEEKLYADNVACLDTAALPSCEFFLAEGIAYDIAITDNGEDSILVTWESDSPIDSVYSFELQPSAVPVPSSIWLFGSALLGLVVARRREG